MSITKKKLKKRKKCLCNCIKCKKTIKGKKKHCKRCMKKSYKCCVKSRKGGGKKSRGKKSRGKKSRGKKRTGKKRTSKKRTSKKNLNRYKQSGCSKQKGGYKCNEATNMGSIYGGSKLNLLTRDITIPQSTQNAQNAQNDGLTGGGFLINAGLGKGVDIINNIGNGIKNTMRSAYGDHHLEDSNVMVASKLME